MNASLASRRLRPARSTRRLAMESLERREVMTTTWLILDYTPDTHAGSLRDTFYNSRYAGNIAPKFLDFNGDRWVNDTDVSIAAGQIGRQVGALFNSAATGFDVRLQWGDTFSNTNWGSQFVRWGQQYASQQVAVMFVGGRNTGEIGRAPEASDGANVEGYGQTYSQAISDSLMRSDPGNTGRATSGDFVARVAQTIAHELGHMLGVRHARNQYSNDMMNPVQSQNAGAQRFLNVNRVTENGTWQNAYQELRNSFAGQRQVSGFYGSGRPELDEHHHDADEVTNVAARNDLPDFAVAARTSVIDQAFAEFAANSRTELPRSPSGRPAAQARPVQVERATEALATALVRDAKPASAPSAQSLLEARVWTDLVAEDTLA